MCKPPSPGWPIGHRRARARDAPSVATERACRTMSAPSRLPTELQSVRTECLQPPCRHSLRSGSPRGPDLAPEEGRGRLAALRGVLDLCMSLRHGRATFGDALADHSIRTGPASTQCYRSAGRAGVGTGRLISAQFGRRGTPSPSPPDSCIRPRIRKSLAVPRKLASWNASSSVTGRAAGGRSQIGEQQSGGLDVRSQPAVAASQPGNGQRACGGRLRRARRRACLATAPSLPECSSAVPAGGSLTATPRASAWSRRASSARGGGGGSAPRGACGRRCGACRRSLPVAARPSAQSDPNRTCVLCARG